MWEITSPRSADIPDQDIKGLKVRDKRTRNADGTPKRISDRSTFQP